MEEDPVLVIRALWLLKFGESAVIFLDQKINLFTLNVLVLDR